MPFSASYADRTTEWLVLSVPKNCFLPVHFTLTSDLAAMMIPPCIMSRIL